MTDRHHRAPVASSLGLVVALLALCLRLLAPAGWMPVASGNGVTLALCSGKSMMLAPDAGNGLMLAPGAGNGLMLAPGAGNGKHQLAFAPAGEPIDPDTGDGQAEPCAFSGLGTPALPDVPTAMAAQVLGVIIATGLWANAYLRLAAMSWARPPSRGPPQRELPLRA